MRTTRRSAPREGCGNERAPLSRKGFCKVYRVAEDAWHLTGQDTYLPKRKRLTASQPGELGDDTGAFGCRRAVDTVSPRLQPMGFEIEIEPGGR